MAVNQLKAGAAPGCFVVSINPKFLTTEQTTKLIEIANDIEDLTEISSDCNYALSDNLTRRAADE